MMHFCFAASSFISSVRDVELLPLFGVLCGALERRRLWSADRPSGRLRQVRPCTLDRRTFFSAPSMPSPPGRRYQFCVMMDSAPSFSINLEPEVREKILAAIKFDDRGLVPAIAQQHDSKEVLMMAWMNEDSVAETLSTGRVCYWSRSRSRLWRKGEESGQVQSLVDFRVDCDGDTVLVLVDQKGVACHTGRTSCFFTGVKDGDFQVVSDIRVDPRVLYKSLKE